MSASVYIGHHDNGATIQPFYTGLKTKAAARKAAAFRFGDGAVALRPCECAEREILSQVDYMRLTLSERGREVRRPLYISPHRSGWGETRLANEVSEFARAFSIPESEAYARISDGYDLTGLESQPCDHVDDAPF